MRIRRTLDARFLNSVANDPEVRPWIGGTGPLDLAGVIADPANIALEASGGGWVFAKHEPGVYELHTLFLKKARGRACLAACDEAARYMFTATDAREIVTRVPAGNRAAGFASTWCGFVERFRREDAFVGADGGLQAVSYRALTLDAWTFRDAEALRQGRIFHAQIEVAKLKADSALRPHPEDEAHDRAVGASALMIRAGNAAKGVWAYNRWARLAGYAPIVALSQTPLLIDIGVGVIVEVRNGEMEIVQCP